MQTAAKWLSYTFLLLSFIFALGGMWGSGIENDHSLWPPCILFAIIGILLFIYKTRLEEKAFAVTGKYAPQLSIPMSLLNGVLLTLQLFSVISTFNSVSMLYKILVKGYPTPKEFDFVTYELSLLGGSVLVFVIAYLIRRRIRRTAS